MAPVIKFENVFKRYRLGSGRGSLREAISNLPKCLVGRSGNPRDDSSYIWALKDVSFEVEKGEALGIIGPNGAGKTTALKLLAGVTRPTSGHIEINGKLSALIELGAGFHPDLTGRENVYLNASILGLKKAEVGRLYDDIVEFAELGPFMDTPVKRYSSGMYVRLGFAVAAHTGPEVLLVDEVLAVGDASFRGKCYRKIRGLREGGTTVVLVSHDMTQVKNLSDRALLLLKGKAIESGDVDKVIRQYHQIAFQEGSSLLRRADLGATCHDQGELRPLIEVAGVSFLNGNGTCTDCFTTGETLRIRISYDAHEAISRPTFGVAIHAVDGTVLTGTNTKLSGYPIENVKGKGAIEFVVPRLALLPGMYLVTVAIHDQFMGSYDRREQAYRLRVISGPVIAGVFYSPHFWELRPPDVGSDQC